MLQLCVVLGVSGIDMEFELVDQVVWSLVQVIQIKRSK